jgi:hypothetical protein
MRVFLLIFSLLLMKSMLLHHPFLCTDFFNASSHDWMSYIRNGAQIFCNNPMPHTIVQVIFLLLHKEFDLADL